MVAATGRLRHQRAVAAWADIKGRGERPPAICAGGMGIVGHGNRWGVIEIPRPLKQARRCRASALIGRAPRSSGGKPSGGYGEPGNAG